MSEYEKPPPYAQEAPPTMNQPRGYNGAAPILTSAQMQSPGNTYGGVPAGYTTVPAASMPSYGSTVYVQQVPVLPQVVLVGGCPACRVGVLEDDFTCLGVCLAILFFPLGILCCLAMKQRRCPNCGAIFG